MKTPDKLEVFLMSANETLSAGRELTHNQDCGLFLLRDKIRVPDQLSKVIRSRLAIAYQVPESGSDLFEVLDLLCVLDSRNVDLAKTSQEYAAQNMEELMSPYSKNDRFSPYRPSYLAFTQLNTLAAAYGLAKQELANLQDDARDMDQDPDRHFKYGRSATWSMVEEGYRRINAVAYAVSQTKGAYGLALTPQRDIERVMYLEVQRNGDTVAKAVLEKFGFFETAQEIGLKFKDHDSSQLAGIVKRDFDPSVYLVV